MEKALFVQTAAQAEKALQDGTGCQRIYLGSEFCHRLLPSPAQLCRAVDACRAAGVPLTLATPIIPQEGLEDVLGLVELLSAQEGEWEILAGDFGLLHHLHREYPGRFTLVLGRVLAKQKSGPRIELIKDARPQEYASSRLNHLNVPSFLSLLKSLGVSRLEMDWPIQGIDGEFLQGLSRHMSLSVWHPFVYVSATLRCPMRMAGGCSCQGQSYRLTSGGMNVPLICRGNVIFYRNDADPASLPPFFDREVCQAP